MAFFSQLEPYAGDPILGLFEAFQKDARSDKVNLSIGIYFDDAGRIPLLASVHEAETRLLALAAPKAYLPIDGSPAMQHTVQALLFGAQHPLLREGRVVTMQSVGSSGGLKVAADLLHRWLPQSEVWVSDPTWDNHRAMFEGAGLKVHTYPYYDSASGGLRFEQMCQTLRDLPPRSIVLLHACCHNPTGVDLSHAQWRELMPLLRDRELLPFVDLAYQGYGDGLHEDAFALRLMADEGLSFIVANSFSKSMSVYGERAGALTVVCTSREEAALVTGQLKAAVRRNYSNPGVHAAGIVATVLGDAKLRAQWEGEVAAMRERIAAMRRALHDALKALRPERSFGYLLTQRGMFSYTGLSPQQVDTLREEHAVYLVRSGRMCVAGLNSANVQRTAKAIASVL